ncbi:MAG: hypothetical protein H6823_24100 [Planctomycetaceae bacterium]|nr:hypothetical protein [Planctomycetales bacterium]MCA9143192.1 hypothetical protein [Planctomycetales bacterium]MCB9941327.1 hypothetical protein [Planctomycetaceae bacterium]
MKRAMILFALLTGGLANLSLSPVGAAMPDQVPVAQDDHSATSDQNSAPAVTTAIEAPTSDEADPGIQSPEVANPAADHEPDLTTTVESVAGEKPSQVMLHFKIFRVSTQRAAEAGIDLAAILSDKPHNKSTRENTYATSANAEALLSTISLRERELLAKLLSVSGAAKLLAEPTLLTECGRKAKFFSGAEVPSPGPPKDGAVTTEFRDVGTKIEATTSLRDAQTIVAELRVDYSEISLLLEVPPNGFMFPPVRTHSVQTALLMALNKTAVLGGPLFDGMLVMVTPELVMPGSDPVQHERIVAHHQPEFSVPGGQIRQLQMEVESLHVKVKQLTDLVEQGIARKRSGMEGPVPPILPLYQPATPGHWPRANTTEKAKPQLARSRDLSVNSKWEELPTGDSLFTIRIGGGLYKLLYDGIAIESALDGASRKLREFRIVMGPTSLQESFGEANSNPKVGYGWRPNRDGGLDYYVQVSRACLESLSKGGTLNCTVHPDVDAIDTIYVFTGDAPLPREAAR